jgi:hypothetical protein
MQEICMQWNKYTDTIDQAFMDAISKISKNHNLFIEYLNNPYSSA